MPKKNLRKLARLTTYSWMPTNGRPTIVTGTLLSRVAPVRVAGDLEADSMIRSTSSAKFSEWVQKGRLAVESSIRFLAADHRRVIAEAVSAARIYVTIYRERWKRRRLVPRKRLSF